MVTLDPATGERCFMCGKAEEIIAVKFKDEQKVFLCFGDFKKAWNNRTKPKKTAEAEAPDEPAKK